MYTQNHYITNMFFKLIHDQINSFMKSINDTLDLNTIHIYTPVTHQYLQVRGGFPDADGEIILCSCKLSTSLNARDSD